MADMEWQPGLVVGFGKMDDDHRALVEAMRQLQVASDQGQDKDEIAKILNFLRDYTVTHFGTEESLMIRHNYPAASAHFAAHAGLVMQVSDFIADYRTGNIVGIPEMLAFLEKWLLEHIKGPDRDLGAFLASRRIES